MNGKTEAPEVHKSEQAHQEAEKRASPGARVVYEAVLLEGEEELGRSSSALAWSGLAAGLSMGFSLLVQGLLRAHLLIDSGDPYFGMMLIEPPRSTTARLI